MPVLVMVPNKHSKLLPEKMMTQWSFCKRKLEFVMHFRKLYEA